MTSLRSAPWRSPLTVAAGEAAAATAIDVATRLRRVGSGDVVVEPGQAGLESSAGVAVLFGQLNRMRPGDGWDRAAHLALADATRNIESPWNAHPGLFGGLGGIAFAALSLSCGGTRYQQLLEKLEARIVPAALERGQELARAPRGLPSRAFDAIVGLAGTAGYLLRRRENPAAVTALEAILTGLVVLSEKADDGPNWLTPYEKMMQGSPMAARFPEGVLNCGLSHGIPGPMVALSLALIDGVSVPGQAEAIERSARWLIENRADDGWGLNWPSGVSPLKRPVNPAQSAWCYGSPGVARALWLAGSAVRDEKLQALALEAMSAVYRRPWSVRMIGSSPGLCHGIAGLLQITLRFGYDTADPMFDSEAAALTDRLLSIYQPERPLGYFAVEGGGVLVDRPGLLDGAAGSALALLAAATDLDPDWDRLLLLA